ncbi:MAG: peptidylprolyl isomerase, partial [Kiritimatiellia bacterium]
REIGDGLSAHDLAPGTGPGIGQGDSVRLHISLWKQDGTAIFSTHDQSGAMDVRIGAGSLIPGVEKGVIGLAVGGQRLLVVPASLAYGDNPTNGAPAGTLHVLVERLPDPAAPPAPVDAPVAAAERVPPESPPEVTEWRELSNGIRIATLREGDGPTPTKDQLVVCEYTGWLASDGTRFDSSLARAESFSFPYGRGRVIRGWEKGLRDMKVGERRVLYIPAYLGYGGAGQGNIPAHSDLIFELELLELR